MFNDRYGVEALNDCKMKRTTLLPKEHDMVTSVSSLDLFSSEKPTIHGVADATFHQDTPNDMWTSFCLVCTVLQLGCVATWDYSSIMYPNALFIVIMAWDAWGYSHLRTAAPIAHHIIINQKHAAKKKTQILMKQTWSSSPSCSNNNNKAQHPDHANVVFIMVIIVMVHCRDGFKPQTIGRAVGCQHPKHGLFSHSCHGRWLWLICSQKPKHKSTLNRQ